MQGNSVPSKPNFFATLHPYYTTRDSFHKSPQLTCSTQKREIKEIECCLRAFSFASSVQPHAQLQLVQGAHSITRGARSGPPG